MNNLSLRVISLLLLTLRIFANDEYTLLSPHSISKKSFNNIHITHVSAYNGSWCVVEEETNGYYVTIDDITYGPFDETDVIRISPFKRNSKNWHFRAYTAGNAFLYINGKKYGPYKHIWTPNFSSSEEKWGALIQNDDGYHFLINGVESDAYSFIFSYRDISEISEGAYYNRYDEVDIPFYYGKDDNWIAIASKDEDGKSLYIESSYGKSGPFSMIDNYTYEPENSEFPLYFWDYTRYLTNDTSTFAAGVVISDENGEHNSMYMRGAVIGDFDRPLTTVYQLTPYFMASDGSNWIVKGEGAIYTKDQIIKVKNPFLAEISSDGKRIAYSYEPEPRNEYFVVNDKTYGPFDSTDSFSFLETDDKWISRVTQKNDDGTEYYQYLMTGSGKTYGPFMGIYPTGVKDGWVAVVKDEAAAASIMYNGEIIAGPFDIVRFPIEGSFLKDQWSVIGGNENDYTVIRDGIVRGTYGPFIEKSPPIVYLSSDSESWSFFAGYEDDYYIVSNGEISAPLGIYKRTLIFQYASYQNVLRVTAMDSSNQKFALFKDHVYGPFDQIRSFCYANKDPLWAFSVTTLEGKHQIISNHEVSESFDAVKNFSLEPVSATLSYIAAIGENDFAIIKGKRFGPFNNASIATNEKGSFVCEIKENRLIVYKVLAK